MCLCFGIQRNTICPGIPYGDNHIHKFPDMVTAVKLFFKIIGLILIGSAVSIIVLISFPLLLLYAGVKIVGGMASKIK